MKSIEATRDQARHPTRDGVRYALYARTAAGGREAVDAQLAALRAAVAERADGRVAREHVDVNVAAGSGAGLAALLHDLSDGSADAVLVTDLARLSRSSPRLADLLAAVELSGAQVVSATEGA
jgi:DNA invertase Pin-like site-specific DNA recombinase